VSQEVVEWLANPENLNAENLPPFINDFDVIPYLQSALPIAGSVLGINVLHEVLQRTVASVKKVMGSKDAREGQAITYVNADSHPEKVA
jgi:hypothetical protein